MTTGHDKKRTSELASDFTAGRISRAKFLRLVGGVAVVGASASLIGVGARRAAAAQGGTLSVGITSDIKTLDPHRSTLDVFRHSIRSAVFDSLIFSIPATLEVQPELAESWTVSPDGQTVTFKLRQGVDLARRLALHRGRRRLHDQARPDPKIAAPVRPAGRVGEERRRRDDTTARFNLSDAHAAAPRQPAAGADRRREEHRLDRDEADRHRARSSSSSSSPATIIRSRRTTTTGSRARRCSTSSSSRTCRTRSPGSPSCRPARCR